MTTPAATLLPHLHVEPVGDRRFTARCVAGQGGRIYGGQVAAHSLAAAGRTLGVDAGLPASLHVHFLAAGDITTPVEYLVHDLKDGRSFAVRQVEARQDGRVLAVAVATFHAPEDAPEHVLPPPSHVGPEQCPELDLSAIGGDSPAFAAIEARLVPATDTDARASAIRLWARPRGALGADPLVHACALTWLTDLTMTRTVDRPRQHWRGFRQGASLDHTVWFHGRVDADSWLLGDQVSEVYVGARGLAQGAWYDEAGRRVASSAQDCLIRRPATEPSTQLSQE